MIEVRPAAIADSPQIAEIYNYYIEYSHATFETEPIDGSEIHRRIDEGWANGYPFLVCQLGAELVGYAYGRQFRPRSAYRYSIETSVYVKHNNVGQKIGTTLYEKLLSEIREKDFHAVIAGISLPNDASVFFHENFGFEKVAHFREVGHKFGRWIDVGYWELLLNKTWVCHV